MTVLTALNAKFMDAAIVAAEEGAPDNVSKTVVMGREARKKA